MMIASLRGLNIHRRIPNACISYKNNKISRISSALYSNKHSPVDTYEVPPPASDYTPRMGHAVSRSALNKPAMVTDITPTTATQTNAMYHSWKMIRFDADGKVRMVDVPRSDLYSKFGLQGRDIRIVVSNTNYPTIMVRKHCIVLDIRNLSAIITENAMYLLKNDSFNPSIIPFIQQEIKYHRTTSQIMHRQLLRPYPAAATSTSQEETSVSEEDSGSDQYHHTQQYGYFEHSHALPFEFQMLECLLHKACREIENEFCTMETQARRSLYDPSLGTSEDLLFEILKYKRELNKFNTFVREMREAVEALLQSDEDMAAMYLTDTYILNRPRAIDNHEEIEMLLETYYTQLEDILNRIEELRNDINSTQDFLEICLDSIRNRMIEYDLRMTITGVAITIGTLIAGLFGMNLINHWEHSPNAFLGVSLTIAMLVISIFLTIMNRMRRRGVFSSFGQYFSQKNRRLN